MSRSTSTRNVLDQMGEKSLLSGVAMVLAETLYRKGRMREAEEWTHVAENAAAPDDVLAQIGWRGVRAKVLATWGSTEDAVALAREATSLAARTDLLTIHAGALMDQAAVLTILGRDDKAAPPLRDALALYERKGDIVSAAKARATLAELAAAAS